MASGGKIDCRKDRAVEDKRTLVNRPTTMAARSAPMTVSDHASSANRRQRGSVNGVGAVWDSEKKHTMSELPSKPYCDCKAGPTA